MSGHLNPSTHQSRPPGIEGAIHVEQLVALAQDPSGGPGLDEFAVAVDVAHVEQPVA